MFDWEYNWKIHKKGEQTSRENILFCEYGYNSQGNYLLTSGIVM